MAIELPIWIYWLSCGLATLVLAVNRERIPVLLSPDLVTPQTQREGYWPSLILGWGLTAIAAIFYVLLTQKQVPGSYHLSDLMLFSVMNGCLEQLMFVFWLLVGCWGAVRFGVKVPWQIFGIGFLSYSIFSGAIHALFWIRVLPEHQPAWVMPFFLLGMSLLWMWLFWRYRAIVAIIAMHTAIDFLTVGHLHFSWFVPYQGIG